MVVVVVVQLTPVGIKIIASPPWGDLPRGVGAYDMYDCNVVFFSIYLVTAVHIVCAARSM